MTVAVGSGVDRYRKIERCERDVCPQRELWVKRIMSEELVSKFFGISGVATRKKISLKRAGVLAKKSGPARK